jgi:acyl-CoA thioester hydrolase
MMSYRTVLSQDWVDYNGHLRDAFYLLIFSYATDAFMARIGVDPQRDNRSLFTLECHLNYLHEVKLDARVQVQTRVLAHDRKRVQVYHTLHLQDSEAVLAASEQMLLHVDLAGPKSVVFGEASLAELAEVMQAGHGMPEAEYAGRRIALPG